jgi:hypothetical protein
MVSNRELFSGLTLLITSWGLLILAHISPEWADVMFFFAVIAFMGYAMHAFKWGRK